MAPLPEPLEEIVMRRSSLARIIAQICSNKAVIDER
jgi:hypothetical protein